MKENPVRATPEQLERVATFSTCEIADALVKLSNPSGGFLTDLDLYNGETGKPLVAEAFTVEVSFRLEMVDSRETEAPKLEQHFVDLAEPGTIVVVTTPPYVKNASLGGLLATALHRKGVKGFITSGRCRDLAELRDLKGFPVYARGHSVLGQSPFTRPSRVQVPLTFTSPPAAGPASPSDLDFPATTVHPYDIILADLDGVVAIRPDVLGEVLGRAEKAREVDRKCLVDLQAGAGVKETFKQHRGG